jgi:DNA-directed RNA polymerase subunit M/transcription elongation factor TFIIS
MSENNKKKLDAFAARSTTHISHSCSTESISFLQWCDPNIPSYYICTETMYRRNERILLLCRFVIRNDLPWVGRMQKKKKNERELKHRQASCGKCDEDSFFAHILQKRSTTRVGHISDFFFFLNGILDFFEYSKFWKLDVNFT